MKPIVLASQSQQRKTILQSLNIPFEVAPAYINEQEIVAKDPLEKARLIALTKVKKVAESYQDAVIIGADTFTVFHDRVYEKPRTKQEAVKMLQEQSGQTGYCFTGFAFLNVDNGFDVLIENTTVVTKITLRKLSNTEIKLYVDSNPVSTWSAGFSPAYPQGATLVKNIFGSFTSFTYGIPMELVVPLLNRTGYLKN